MSLQLAKSKSIRLGLAVCRASALFLAAPGIALIVGACTQSLGDGFGAVMVRFCAFGATTLMALRVAQIGTERTAESLYRPAATAALLILFTLGCCAIWPGLLLRPSDGATIVFAAAVEELIFRVELPIALASVLADRSSSSIYIVAGTVGSQISFSLTHVVLSGGVDTGRNLPEFVRLIGCGCSLAVVYICSGLAPAIALHAASNFGTLTWRFGAVHYPSEASIFEWAAAVTIILAVAVRRRSQPGLRSLGDETAR